MLKAFLHLRDFFLKANIHGSVRVMIVCENAREAHYLEMQLKRDAGEDKTTTLMTAIEQFENKKIVGIPFEFCYEDRNGPRAI